ncbi:MAG: hypothetical protein Q9213_001216 [Squamulea squamosa]
MEKLEILENDAMQQLVSVAYGCPHVVEAIKLLNIRSYMRFDQNFQGSLDEVPFGMVLQQLIKLKTLVLTLGDCFNDRDYLPSLYQYFPPNIETLRFRSSVALAKSDIMEKWENAITDGKTLPRLRRLSFVLDLPDWEHQRLAQEQAIREWEDRELEKSENGRVSLETEDAEVKLDYTQINQEYGGDDKSKDLKTNAATADPSMLGWSAAEQREITTGKVAHVYADGEPILSFGEEKDAMKEVDQSPDGQKQSKPHRWAQDTAPDDQLKAAKNACEQLWEAARSKGIIVEPFEEKWHEELGLMGPDYERWDALCKIQGYEMGERLMLETSTHRNRNLHSLHHSEQLTG